jgi:outer membrane usher protein
VDLGAAPPDVSYARRPSAFFNYAPSVTASTQGPLSASGFFEAGVSEKNRLWYSGLYAATAGGVARGLTNLTIDDRPRMLRLTVGDANVATGAIGGAAVLGGVTFARDFTENPYFIRFPSMRFTSSTDVPATVDVYVNGVRVKSVPLDPGTFTLDGVRGLVGGGTVSYVLRDALGGGQTFSMPYYVGPTVLAKGVSDFAVSVGFPRDGIGTQSFAYEGPAAMGYYQVGVTDHLTLGARAEAIWARASGGPFVAVTTPAGLFSLEGGASAASDGGFEGGVAGVFSYSYLSRAFNAGASLRAQSDRYATVTLTPDMDRSLVQASIFTSVPAGKRASIGTQFSLDDHRDLPTIASVSLFSQVQLSRGLTLLAQAGLATVTPPKSEIDGFLLLSWTTDTKLSATGGVVSNGGAVGGNLQVAKSSTFGEDWSLAAAATVTPQSTDVSVNHRLQTATNIVATYFDWTGSSATLSVEPAGSVVWVQGAGAFLTRPVYDGFALVEIPNVQGVRVYQNAQEVGRTDKEGHVLVPSLISYYGSQLKIASEDIPLDYALDRDSLVVAPPRRGAGLALFPAVRVHYYRGRVRTVRTEGKLEKEEVPVFGDLAVQNGPHEVVSPIGEGGTFELEGLQTGVHDAEIRYRGDVCRFRLDAREAKTALVDLGLIRCRETAPAAVH